MKNKGRKMARGGILPFAVLGLISVAVMVATLCIPKREIGEFIPPEFDGSAIVGTPDIAAGIGWQVLDAEAFSVGVCGKLIADGMYADVWLTNPESNNLWLKVRIEDEKGRILGESGLIRPGEYVRSVALEKLPRGETPVVLKLMAYQPDTYFSEGVVSLRTTLSPKN